MKLNAIFNQLITNRHISLRTNTKKEHESLRTSLVKKFSVHKNLLTSIGFDDDSTVLSLCASYLADTGISEFRIATRKQFSKEWEVVDND